jgi:signal peptidase I
MKATLLVGDYLFVSKYTYGYSHYSLPLSPNLFSGRIGDFAKPDRGDIVVFRLPKEDSTDYIKRVIGLPGDSIQMIDGILNINGKPIPRERIDDFIDEDEGGRATRVRRWKETLPNGVSYTTLDLPYNLQADNTEVYNVPPNNYFMMGDNRHNSTDSRFPQVGYVPFENIVGRAQLIFFSVHEGERAWEVWRSRCAGAGCSRSCDEARRQTRHDVRRSEGGKAGQRPRRCNCAACAVRQEAGRASQTPQSQARRRRQRAGNDHRLQVQGPRSA